MSIQLLEYAESYVLSRDVTSDYADLLRARLRRFVAWCGGSLALADLDCEIVNRYLAWLATTGVKPVTVDNHRRAILAVWNDAFQFNVNNNPPLRVRKIKKPRDAVEAFTHLEILQLVEYAATLRDYFPNGIRRGDFWVGLIYAGYSTGLRRGDLLRITRQQIGANGVTRIRQNKTGNMVCVCFCQESLEKIDKMACDHDDKAFRWPYHTNALPRQFRAIVKAAGVRRGQFKWLRRSAGSYSEREQPGRGHLTLGHKSPAVFHAFYEDHEITRDSPISPPPLLAVQDDASGRAPSQR